MASHSVCSATLNYLCSSYTLGKPLLTPALQSLGQVYPLYLQEIQIDLVVQTSKEFADCALPPW